MDFKTASIEDLVKDAKQRGKEAIDLLKSFRDKKIVDKRGVERQVSYMTIKRAYFEKFYPEQVPQPKPRPMTINEWLDTLDEE